MGPGDPGSNPGSPINFKSAYYLFRKMTTKKIKHAGKFGTRYGLRQKRRYNEIIDKKPKVCPFCHSKGLKRIAAGIWYCPKCKRKFVGNAYNI